MPQRFLRPGITTSDNWNACSFPAQSLYIRILTLVDDFGRHDARPAILHGQCFALRTDIKPQQTAALRDELAANGLLLIYQHEGKEYLQMLRWQERSRSPKSKYPDPPQDSAADGSEAQGKDASLVPRSSPLHLRSSPSTKRPQPSAAADLPPSLKTEDFESAWKDWQEHRKEIKHPLTPKSIAEQIKQFEEWGAERAIRAIRHTIRQQWRGIREPDSVAGNNGSAPAAKGTDVW